MNRIGVVTLGWAGMTREAGVFNMVANLAMLTVLPRTAVNALLAPTIAAIYARRDAVGTAGGCGQTSLWTVARSPASLCNRDGWPIPYSAGLALASQRGYPRSASCSLAQIVTAGAGSQLSLLTMTGHERPAVLAVAVGAATNLGSSSLLVPRLGLTGAALAAAASLLVWNGVMALMVWRKLHFLPGNMLRTSG